MLHSKSNHVNLHVELNKNTIMKTKNILLYGAMATMALTVTSCGDDFLSVQPASSVPIDGYYNTKAHIDEAVTAAYDPLSWFDYFNGWAPLFLVTDAQGDDIYVGGGSTSDQTEIHLASQYKATGLMNFGGAWTTAYSGINRSNWVIKDAEEASVLSDAERKQYVDEAKTVRAFYYLVLWKLWGNIPYYEKNLEMPYIAEQLSASDVYEKQIAILEDVIKDNVLPIKESDARVGHATKAFAEMLYADYVMYQRDESRYAKALGYMEEIINSQQYSLMDDYAAIWEQNGEWCDESIFEISYFSNGSKRTWGNANAPGGSVVPAMIGIDGLTYVASKEHLAANSSYAPKQELNSGWGFCDVSKEVYDLYEENDQRRTGGILCMDEYSKAYLAATGDTVKYGGRYQNTGIFLLKYLGRPGGNANTIGDADLGWDNNQRIYRYSETLLNAAELLLRTNGDVSKAQRYFNKVRDRAHASQRTVSLPNILEERRLEFVGEGKRYYDLIRFGEAKNVLKAGGGKVYGDKITDPTDNRPIPDKDKRKIWSWTSTKQGIPERVDWTENKKYLPIPKSEIDAAQGTLTQNPY